MPSVLVYSTYFKTCRLPEYSPLQEHKVQCAVICRNVFTCAIMLRSAALSYMDQTRPSISHTFFFRILKNSVQVGETKLCSSAILTHLNTGNCQYCDWWYKIQDRGDVEQTGLPRHSATETEWNRQKSRGFPNWPIGSDMVYLRQYVLNPASLTEWEYPR